MRGRDFKQNWAVTYLAWLYAKAEGREVIAAAADIDCIESVNASEEPSSYVAIRE